MSNNTNTPRSSSDSEILILILAAGLLLGGAGTALTLAWSKILSWCLQQRVLLPAAADPLVAVPHTGGAGLDLPRLAVAAAVLLSVLAVTASTTRKYRARGELR